MHKLKQTECKKSFIRNTEQIKPKTVVISNPQVKEIDVEPKETYQQEDKKSSKDLNQQFDASELNSALKIVQQIKSVENVKPKKLESVSDLNKKAKLAIDEKTSRQLNFPPDKPIYRDLIPLCFKTPTPTISYVSRDPLPLKDKEPSLSDFFKPGKLPEYNFKVPLQNNYKTLNQQHNGLKLYKVMQNWN